MFLSTLAAVAEANVDPRIDHECVPSIGRRLPERGALHANARIERGKFWQAEPYVGATRDHAPDAGVPQSRPARGGGAGGRACRHVERAHASHGTRGFGPRAHARGGQAQLGYAAPVAETMRDIGL
jgi:hypothetical protein